MIGADDSQANLLTGLRLQVLVLLFGVDILLVSFGDANETRELSEDEYCCR